MLTKAQQKAKDQAREKQLRDRDREIIARRKAGEQPRAIFPDYPGLTEGSIHGIYNSHKQAVENNTDGRRTGCWCKQHRKEAAQLAKLQPRQS